MDDTSIVVFITAGHVDEARSLARGLLEKRLAACVNIVPGVESHYWWEGQLDTAQEYLLIVKTRQEHLAALTAEVKALHSYSVPEVIGFPIVGGNSDYLQWLLAETS